MRLPILIAITALLGLPTSTTAESTTPRVSSVDCHPRAWVRAPDLVPGLITPAHARLSLNGTECGEVQGWKVGLRMKERAIFKFHAANVTMPKRPVIEDIPLEDDDEDDASMGPFILGDIFETHSVRHVGRTKRYEALRVRLREYEDSLAARSLWTSRSATREVFDSSVSLPLDAAQKDSTDIRTTWLADFRVNVPSTNFPYGVHRTMHFSSGEAQQDISSVESMFEYYFIVTYDDGTVIDIPAGKSAFIPAAVGHGEERGTKEKEIKMVDDRPEWDDHGVPECDRGLVSGFNVTVELPTDIALVAGTTHMLPVTIHKTGNSSQVPTRISARISSCTCDTWAASYAFDTQHQRETTTCPDLESSDGESEQRRRGMPLMPLFLGDEGDRISQTKREEGYEVPRIGARGPREMWLDDMSGRPPIGSPTDLAGFLGSATVLVNVTIPEDIAYTANRTLQNTENRLYINLQTRHACQASAATQVGDELTDDELWSPWWRESFNPATRNRAGGNWFGNAQVAITPPPSREWTSSAPLVDYKDANARAIVLSALEAPELRDDEYPAVSVVITESEEDLQRAKYDVWSRLPLCKEYKTRGHCVHGLAGDLVGELWARYQWRKDRRQGSEAAKQGSQVVLQ